MAAKPLVHEALLSFGSAARARVDEVRSSAPFDSASFRITPDKLRDRTGFQFALRALTEMAPHASEGIMEALLRWHDHEREQTASSFPAQDEREVRECAVNVVFCEATLALLAASPIRAASRGAILIDALQERSLEYFLLASDTRHAIAQRRLAVLAGSSEEALWTRLVSALSSHSSDRFESISNKVLMQLEAAGGSGARGRSAVPGRGALAMCRALRGLRLPTISKSARQTGHAQALAFLQRVERLLLNRQLRCLHRPVCESLGDALLEQQHELLLKLAAERAEPHGSSDIDTLSAYSLQRLAAHLSLWAASRVGMRRSLTASFESYGAPLATALACAVTLSGPVARPLASTGHLPHGEEDSEMHARLSRKLLKCLKQAELSHRLLSLRCLQLQLPVLLDERGATKENLALIDELFFGRPHVLRLDLPREKDVPLLLRRYGELLDALSNIALVVSRTKLELAIERVVMVGLRFEAGKKRKWGNSGVLSMAALCRILQSRPSGLGPDPWGVSRRDEIVEQLVELLRACSGSKYLSETPQAGAIAHWLLALQLLCGSMRCLRLLWASAPVQQFISVEEVLLIAANQLCSVHRPLQDASSELLETVISSTPHTLLPLALDALLRAAMSLLSASHARRRVALAHIVQLLALLLHKAPPTSAALAASVEQLQAFAFLLLAEPDPRVRGEAAQLLLLLSAIVHGDKKETPTPSDLEAAGVAAVAWSAIGTLLAQCLPTIVDAVFEGDPWQVQLWGVGGRSGAHDRSHAALRRAAEQGSLRSFAEALGGSEVEQQLWVCCVQAMTGALIRAGAESTSALSAAWPMLIGRCPRVAHSSSLPPTWTTTASLVCAMAGVVLSRDESEARRVEIERVVREAVRLLLSDSEGFQLSGSAVLGQLRGGASVQLVLSELATPLRQVAAESEWALHSTKNAASRSHVHLRQLSHVLSLLCEQASWPQLLVSCGAPLAALSQFVHGALEYLEKPWNLHTWSLHRTRVYMFNFLAHTTPALLSVLSANVSGSQRMGLRQSAVLSRVSRLVHACVDEGATQALDLERTRLLQASASDATAIHSIECDLRAQAEATQAASLDALAALATMDAVGTMEGRGTTMICVEALLHSQSERVTSAALAALRSLWAATVEPLTSCLERCYNSATQVAANAHFICLVDLVLGGHAEEAAAMELRVPLLVLALGKLADPISEIRCRARQFLHANGAAFKGQMPPSLLGEGLPWASAPVQLEVSTRLAVAMASHAPLVVSEVLRRASRAPPPLAGVLLDLLPPWIEQASLRLLSGCNVQPRGEKEIEADSRKGASPGLGMEDHTGIAASDGEVLMSELLDATLHHIGFGHAMLARPVHALWKALAVHEESIPEIIRILLKHSCSRVQLHSEENGVRLDSGVARPEAALSRVRSDASLLRKMDSSLNVTKSKKTGSGAINDPEGSAESNQPEVSSHERVSGRGTVLLAVQAAMLALSSQQPKLCSKLLAEQLVPFLNHAQMGDDEPWLVGFSPEAVSTALAPAHDGLECFSAAPIDELGSIEAIDQLNRDETHGRNLASGDADSEGRKGATHGRSGDCTQQEAALLLLSTSHELAIDALILGVESSTMQRQAALGPRPTPGLAPPPPSHPPPPQWEDLLAYVVHSAVLFRFHGRPTLIRLAAHLLARILSMSDVRRPSARSRQVSQRVNADLESQTSHWLVEALTADSIAHADGKAPTNRGNSPQLQVDTLVEGLLRIIGKRVGPMFCESWSSTALRHGSQRSFARTKFDADLQHTSLIAFRAMVPMLSVDLLHPNARSLMNIACGCALTPSRGSSHLAQEAMLAVRAMILSRGAAVSATVLADIFWRCSALLYSDYMVFYVQSTGLLFHSLSLLSLSDGQFLGALQQSLPSFWKPPPDHKHHLVTTYPGLQQLLLKGLGRRTTRLDCLQLMQLCALHGPTEHAFLEAESTRLLTCSAALLPWLCSKPEESTTSGSSTKRSIRDTAGSERGRECGSAQDVVARTLADGFGTAASKLGRKELLSLAIVLNNHANRQYDQVLDRFWYSMRAAFSQALGPQPAWALYTTVCTLLCGVGVEPECGPQLLSLARDLVGSLAQAHGTGLRSDVEPKWGAPPAPQLWQSLLEISRHVPACSQQLGSTLKTVLSACADGILMPSALVQWQPSEQALASSATSTPNAYPTSTRRRRRREMAPQDVLIGQEETLQGRASRREVGEHHTGGESDIAEHVALSFRSTDPRLPWLNSSDEDDIICDGRSVNRGTDETHTSEANSNGLVEDSERCSLRQPVFDHFGSPDQLSPLNARISSDWHRSSDGAFSEHSEVQSSDAENLHIPRRMRRDHAREYVSHGNVSLCMSNEMKSAEAPSEDAELISPSSSERRSHREAGSKSLSSENRSESDESSDDDLQPCRQHNDPRIQLARLPISPLSPTNSSATPDDKVIVHVRNSAWVDVGSRRRSAARMSRHTKEETKLMQQPSSARGSARITDVKQIR